MYYFGSILDRKHFLFYLFPNFKHCLNGTLSKILVSTPVLFQLLQYPALNFNTAKPLQLFTSLDFQIITRYLFCSFHINTSQFFVCLFTVCHNISNCGPTVYSHFKVQFLLHRYVVQSQITKSLCFTINK